MSLHRIQWKKNPGRLGIRNKYQYPALYVAFAWQLGTDKVIESIARKRWKDLKGLEKSELITLGLQLQGYGLFDMHILYEANSISDIKFQESGIVKVKFLFFFMKDFLSKIRVCSQISNDRYYNSVYTV